MRNNDAWTVTAENDPNRQDCRTPTVTTDNDKLKKKVHDVIRAWLMMRCAEANTLRQNAPEVLNRIHRREVESDHACVVNE